MRAMSMSVTQVSQGVTLSLWFSAPPPRVSVCLFKVLLDWPVLQAIKIFSEARTPGIYKPDYIDALYTFYHEKKPEMVVCPPTPEWKRSSEFDLNGEAVPDDDDDGVPGPDLHVWIIYMRNFDILGFSIFSCWMNLGRAPLL